MATRLDRAESLVAALRTRADSLARADAVSGTKTLTHSEELNLGRDGWGEVEFYVTATYKIDFEFKAVKSADWQDNDDRPTRNVPRAAVEAALRKIVARNARRFMDALIEKL